MSLKRLAVATAATATLLSMAAHGRGKVLPESKTKAPDFCVTSLPNNYADFERLSTSRAGITVAQMNNTYVNGAALNEFAADFNATLGWGKDPVKTACGDTALQASHVQLKALVNGYFGASDTEESLRPKGTEAPTMGGRNITYSKPIPAADRALGAEVGRAIRYYLETGKSDQVLLGAVALSSYIRSGGDMSSAETATTGAANLLTPESAKSFGRVVESAARAAGSRDPYTVMAHLAFGEAQKGRDAEMAAALGQSLRTWGLEKPNVEVDFSGSHFQ